MVKYTFKGKSVEGDLEVKLEFEFTGDEQPKEKIFKIELKDGSIIECKDWDEYVTKINLYRMLVPSRLKKPEEPRRYPKVPVPNWEERVLRDIAYGMIRYGFDGGRM